MLNLPSKISGKTFKKLLSPRGYLDRKTKDALTKLGKTSLLYRGSSNGITKNEAIKTLEAIKAEGIKLGDSRYTKPTDAFRKGATMEAVEQGRLTAIKEQKREAKLEAEKQKHISGRMKMDIDEELRQEELGKPSAHYDPRGVLGKSLRDDIERHQASREKSSDSENEKRDQFFNPRGTQDSKPQLVDPTNLPDMDIG